MSKMPQTHACATAERKRNTRNGHHISFAVNTRGCENGRSVGIQKKSEERDQRNHDGNPLLYVMAPKQCTPFLPIHALLYGVSTASNDEGSIHHRRRTLLLRSSPLRILLRIHHHHHQARRRGNLHRQVFRR